MKKNVGTNDKNGTESSVRNSRLMNIILFVVCLIVAVCVWIYAVQSDTTEYEETFSVKVSLVNTSVLEKGTGLSIFSGDNTSIDVTLVGSRSDVTSLTVDDITATADVSSITSSGTFPLNITVKVNGKATVKSLSNSSVTVYADRRNTVILPIRTRLVRATHQTSYIVRDPVPSVDTVTVMGPGATLDTLDYAEAVIDFDNQMLTTSITSICPIRLISKSGMEVNDPYLSMSISEVQVDVAVYTTKDLPLKIKFANGYFTNDVVSTTIVPNTVRVQGDPVLLATLSEIVLQTIDEKLIVGDVNTTLPIGLPKGVSLFDSKQSDAEVQLLFRESYLRSSTRTINVTNIEATGTSGLYEVVDQSVSVTVRAFPETLDYLQYISAQDITVSVNLSSFGEGVTGTVTAPATVYLTSSAGKYVYPIGEYSVQVVLS